MLSILEKKIGKNSKRKKIREPFRSGRYITRLVVQVKKLRYAAKRLFGALRFARGFKKSACYLWGFLFFFSKIRPFLKLEVGFFST